MGMFSSLIIDFFQVLSQVSLLCGGGVRFFPVAPLVSLIIFVKIIHNPKWLKSSLTYKARCTTGLGR